MIPGEQTSSYKSSYRPEIDGLRAFAVLSVVAFHAFPRWLTGGFIGVDVFFVISGFLISSHIFENLDKEQFSFIDFFARRIRRIFPALILVMACSLAFGWFALLSDEFAHLGKHIASGAAFITNFILVDESGYFDKAAETKPMLHLWTLAVEEQFYIVWPLVLWLVWKRRLNLLMITILVLMVSFYVNLRFVKSYPTETFYLASGRFWELLSGSVLAWLLLHKLDFLGRFKLWVDKFLVGIIHSKKVEADGTSISNLMSVFGLLLLAYGVIFINESLPFPSKWALIPVMGAVLIIASGSKALMNRIFLMNPIAVWFGLISYPLYLWHWPILSFLQIIENGMLPHRDARILAILLSIFLAWVTYLFIEKPIRSSKKNLSLPIFLFALSAVIGGFGAIIHYKNGFNKVAIDGEFGNSHFFAEIDRKYYKCENVSIYETADIRENYHRCWQSKQNMQPNVILLGDSHAEHLFMGIAEKLERENVASYIGVGRPSFSDESFKTIFSELTKVDGFGKTVLITTFYRQDFARYDLLNELRETILRLRDVGYTVILLGDVPSFRLEPSACLGEKVLFRKFDAGCKLNFEEVDNKINLYEPLLQALAEETDIEYLPTNTQLLCDDKLCSMVNEGKLLYRDRHHLNILGSRLIGGDFALRLIENGLLPK